MSSFWLSLPHPVLLALFVLIVYSLLKYIYRITLHPLARFPGPPLARITSLYAASIDCGGTTSVVKLLPEWHRRYGPIVRVRPDELHVHDWHAYCQVFKANTRFDKDPSFYANPAVDGSFFQIPSAKDAKPLRDMFLPHFSKAKVDKLEPLVHEKLDFFLKKLEAEQDSVQLDTAYSALTGDTAMHWTYQESFGLMEAPGFRHKMLLDMDEMSYIMPPLWYFHRALGVFMALIASLPKSIKRKYFPAVAALDAIEATCRDRVLALAAKSEDDREVPDSIFATALHPNVEKGQRPLTPRELTAHACIMFLGGTDTTSNTLAFGTWHILQSPGILTKLRKELDEAMPDAMKLYRQLDLERLSYLRAVIKESIRFSMGTSARLMRLTPTEGATFDGQYIPATTRISFSNYVYKFDADVFEDPFVFRPERWLADDTR
ncbi:Cytochrome P450 monooxygenase aflU [Fulvia fulva]|uniref:Cytochrome P450 monooxygenase aflU n=1 Tax=Passalora fulva TaxID=5499 RepID=A0A9Q8PMF6_PASFU|nr:Cytochrome P450 monooxygenase aflU [Fulvia fulva]KAK4609352.1 Cytochrome P450 monooxygenase aflU [Fulvia fulva]KAK4609569.1 Cytochrome P450 monooxygenase aflU [Fulvia fulva]UJO25126.1 Cytochrome P450 monooxygenase aflU [Fulvia fulva]WPV22927.1 Cytochrome P450 monooxygenase aflU [Fulvia fulva]WPV37688.1 Cytochrome P450 monooxygenase aflU [Fulvia fulva]